MDLGDRRCSNQYSEHFGENTYCSAVYAFAMTLSFVWPRLIS